MRRFLFVCVHNAGRSQMAEALVNRYARERGIDVVGLSAGTVGGSELNPVALEAMREIGISMEGHSPKRLTPEMLTPETTAITMGCGVDAEACPANFIVSQDWGLADPAGQDIDCVRAIRDEIDRCVRKLLDIP